MIFIFLPSFLSFFTTKENTTVVVLLSVSVGPLPANPFPDSPGTKSSQENWKFKDILNTNISTLVFASAFLILVVILVVVIRYFGKKSKAEDQKALIPSAQWDN